MESLKREKKLYRKLGNYSKIMQRKFCMACMEPYMALGYGCQEMSTLVSTISVDCDNHGYITESNMRPSYIFLTCNLG